MQWGELSGMEETGLWLFYRIGPGMRGWCRKRQRIAVVQIGRF